MSVLQIKHCATFGLVLAYIVSETSDSNKEGPLKIASLKDASQGDKDDARPIATRAMRLLRSEMSRVEHAEAAKGTERFGKTKDGEICDLYALGDMITFVSTPMVTRQCLTFILEGGPCTNGADADCCKFLMDITDWGPHVETTWCVCQELLILSLPATYLNDCGVVEVQIPIAEQTRHRYYNLVDWMNMTDEAMDASGNSDDQRTPTPPPVPWIHVNYNKPDPQVCDDTNEKSSSNDQRYDKKRKRNSGSSSSTGTGINTTTCVYLQKSFNSNTSSSPDLQPMGQPSTSTDSGDMLWSSLDVNAKAGIFISKGKEIWKIEQENRVEKKGGPSLVNKPNINKYN
ncbi:hypothetical protein Tco_1262973 [Tanacetum coccineum]